MFVSDGPSILQDRIAMQLMVSRIYPVIDAQTLAEYVARDVLFRTADGSYFLYMASKGRVESEERILFLDCRDALLWLNETPDTFESYWHFAEHEKRRYRAQSTASDAFFPRARCPSYQT
jgi:hypothetical protein